jgi:hypothetical protein
MSSISSSATGPCNPSDESRTTSRRQSSNVGQDHIDFFLHAQGLQDDVGVLEAFGFL